ncbi:hypothetical protein O0I10_009376 [Lichtheimia ornata]|uniref:Coenzyme Q-binding protein COQ10 START domain-containing protein n=1 Tax=Lichtheimia ornata TaxID=688661 RepID=A0AAD7XUI5_9FUNG|nr:uncharacterized protein O0I10_009376 [Lichtheimia ornata]KAJ8654980.1 hypothetical protein O0I10_009376 [Lichtheimia ornata]
MSTSCLIPLLVIIPAAPFLVYIIGLLLPASHIVSRTRTFSITPTRLWSILCDVERYPQWRRRLVQVQIKETKQQTQETYKDDTQQLEDGANTTNTTVQQPRLVFEEYTPRRKIVVVHVEQVPHYKLLRILKEIPTFSGSWTFELEETAANVTQLRITQQGVIRKPMLRVIHMLILGFHRRIDVFLNDLENYIAHHTTPSEWGTTANGHVKPSQSECHTTFFY